MKKYLIIYCAILLSLSLTAFGCMSTNDSATGQVEASSTSIVAFDQQVIGGNEDRVIPKFAYDVDSRFIATLTKEDLHKARSVEDLFSREQSESIASFYSVSVTILDDYKETYQRAAGVSDVLNSAMIKLLQSVDYSTNILVRANFRQQNAETGEWRDFYSTPHITIVPEKQAVYVPGKAALIEYLKANSRDKTVLAQKDKLESGKLYFTVSQEGTISNVKLASTSGYPAIDQRMIELITKAPGKWEAAENAKGEKVDQDLVFSFGTIGC